LPKSPRLTAQEAEIMLLKAKFEIIRTKGSHKIYKKDNSRIVIPFHTNKILHPKIIKQLVKILKI